MVCVCVAWNCVHSWVCIVKWNACIELQIIYLHFTLITWNSDYSLAAKCLAKYQTAVGKCKCVLGVCVCVGGCCLCLCVCVRAEVNVYCRHVWLCWRRREEGQSGDTMLLQSSSRARPAQITTVGPGRVILGARLRIQAILRADSLKEQRIRQRFLEVHWWGEFR